MVLALKFDKKWIDMIDILNLNSKFIYVCHAYHLVYVAKDVKYSTRAGPKGGWAWAMAQGPRKSGAQISENPLYIFRREIIISFLLY